MSLIEDLQNNHPLHAVVLFGIPAWYISDSVLVGVGVGAGAYVYMDKYGHSLDGFTNLIKSYKCYIFT